MVLIGKICFFQKRIIKKLLFRISIRDFLGKNFFNLCPSGLGNYIICRRFAFQKLTWSLKFVIHYKSGVREIVLGMTLTTKPSVSHTELQSYELCLIQWFNSPFSCTLFSVFGFLPGDSLSQCLSLRFLILLIITSNLANAIWTMINPNFFRLPF